MLFKVCSEDHLHQNLQDCLLKIQISRPPQDHSLGLELQICIPTSSLEILTHTRIIGALVRGAEGRGAGPEWTGGTGEKMGR